MKTKQELTKMLLTNLSELQDGRIKVNNPVLTKRLKIELELIYDILGDDVEEEYWNQIEEEINN